MATSDDKKEAVWMETPCGSVSVGGLDPSDGHRNSVSWTKIIMIIMQIIMIYTTC